MYKRQVYGRVVGLRSFRPAAEQVEWVLAINDRAQYCVFSFDASGGPTERAFGELRDPHKRRPGESFCCLSVDFKARVAAVHVVAGYLSLVLLDSRTGAVKDVFEVSLEEANVLDVAFVVPADRASSNAGGGGGASTPAPTSTTTTAAAAASSSSSRPLLAVLYEDQRYARHVKTYEINIKDRTCLLYTSDAADD